LKVFIAGIDGYIGWALAMYLTRKGHEVAGADLYLRREWVEEVGSWSATPIRSMEERLEAFHEVFGESIGFYEGDLRDPDFVNDCFEDFEPEAIVHLGEQPSAPYSMIDGEHITFTQMNNVQGTLNIMYAMREHCPDAHLVKLGTMGEYGTPNVPIPEGFFEIEYRGRKDTLPFPRQPGSFYHLSKVHDSANITLACKLWGIRSTDLMQGVVYGTRTDETEADERLVTRFDFDGVFGTVVNRFCVQADIGYPLSVYGKGGQTRGYINLRDSIRCMELSIENPPEAGEYRVFNQFTETFSIQEIADNVKEAASRLGTEVSIEHIENPRVELEEHFYEPDHQKLLDLGLEPHRMVDALEGIMRDLIAYKDRESAKEDVIAPKILWEGEGAREKALE
jgi:UDP-sulfoquinovose synthase